MAVLVAYLDKKFDVVRIKNRFEEDEVEEVTAEYIQACPRKRLATTRYPPDQKIGHFSENI